jgi:hypothetical protein
LDFWSSHLTLKSANGPMIGGGNFSERSIVANELVIQAENLEIGRLALTLKGTTSPARVDTGTMIVRLALSWMDSMDLNSPDVLQRDERQAA